MSSPHPLKCPPDQVRPGRSALLALVALAAFAPAAHAAQAPYASPITLPATVQAENFDTGGEGVAYHDTEAKNLGGKYRTGEGVDLETTTDTGGGFAIGTGRAGEWVEYTVKVPATGTYDIGLRVSSGGAGGKAHVEYNGRNVTGSLTVAPTGGWQLWTTVWKNGITLAASSAAVLRVSLDSSNVSGSSVANLNSIIVRSSASGQPTSTPTPTPTPASTPTPTPTSTPTPTPTPGPDYPTDTPTPEPDPTPEPEPDPDPVPGIPAPEPVQTSSNVWPSGWSNGATAPAARFESTGIVVGGKIYSFGGFKDYDQHVRRDYVVYDPAKNTWKVLGTMPTGMAETHLGVATDGRYVYFAGGLRGDVREGQKPPQYVYAGVWRYDTTTNAWTQLGNLPEARGAGGLALIGRTLHYFGGVIADINTDKTDHWAYDLDTKQWSTKASMPEAKDHFSTIVLGGQIYAICGEFGHHVEQAQKTSMHRYNPVTNTWTKLASSLVAKSHAEGSTFVSAGKIVIAGGQIANSASTDAVASYDPVKNTWTKLSNLPAKRQGTIVQRIGNKVYITTGGVSTRVPLANTWIGNL